MVIINKVIKLVMIANLPVLNALMQVRYHQRSLVWITCAEIVDNFIY